MANFNLLSISGATTVEEATWALAEIWVFASKYPDRRSRDPVVLVRKNLQLTIYWTSARGNVRNITAQLQSLED